MSHPVGARWRSLTSILLEAGVVTPEQVDAGLVRQRTTGLRIGETLVEMGVVSEGDIGWALARQLEIPFVDLIPETLDPELIRSFPEGVLQRLDAIPLVVSDPALSVAVADPTDPDLVAELERAAGRPLQLALAMPSAIRRVLRDVLGPRHEPQAVRAEPAGDTRFDVEWDRSGASFLLFHLLQARRAGATEIHFLPRGGSVDVHHRVAGRLSRAGTEPHAALYYLLARIEALGGPAIDERVLHAAGPLRCPAGDGEIEVGVSLVHVTGGVAVTVELRPGPAVPPTLDTLGLDPVDLAVLREALSAPAGLGLVIGPRRSGGSTTLACLFAEACTAGRRGLAFGDVAAQVPVELRVTGAAAEAAGVWAAVGMAQCADVVAVDGVLSGDAVRSALSPESVSRLVLLRSDWTDVFALLEHLVARPGARAALADRLRFVVHQRRVAVGAAAPSWNGHRVLFEVLAAGDGLRAALRDGAPSARLRVIAQGEGFRALADRLSPLVAAGELAAGEAARILA